MRRSVVVIAAITGLVLVTGGTAEATFVPPPALVYAPPVSAPMPTGCSATPPTISVVPLPPAWATKVDTTGIDCSPGSGYSVTSASIKLQNLNDFLVWSAFYSVSINPPTASGLVSQRCPINTITGACLGTRARRGLVIYTLTNTTTGIPINVEEPTLVQPSEGTPPYPGPDVLAIDPSGGLWIYTSDGVGGSAQPRQIGTGWNIFTTVVGAGDLTGDQHPDLVAIDHAGNLWLYPGNGTGGFGSRRLVGNGWAGFTAVDGAVDFNGDGHTDLLARDAAGNLWLYPGRGNGTFLSGRKVGKGWAGFTALVTGYFSSDGHPDIFAVDPAGTLWLYEGSGAGGFQSGQAISSGWASGLTPLVNVGNYQATGGGVPDLLGRTGTGGVRLYTSVTYSGYSASSYAYVGSGWNAFTTIIGAGYFSTVQP